MKGIEEEETGCTMSFLKPERLNGKPKLVFFHLLLSLHFLSSSPLAIFLSLSISVSFPCPLGAITPFNIVP